MKQKHSHSIGLRGSERDKARRNGILRLAIVAGCLLIVAAVSLFILVKQGVPDVKADPNSSTQVP